MRLGRTELEVSRIGFGGLPIQRLRAPEAESLVRHAFESGVTFFDTARAYSTSEERIGRALHEVRRQCVFATKTLARTRLDAEADLADSLRALRSEYIDLWQLHCISDHDSYEQSVAPGGVLEAAARAVEEGKVRHIGVTCHALDVAVRAVREDRFSTVQVPINALSPEPIDRLLPAAQVQDVGVIAMKPFAGGAIEDARLAIGFLLQFPTVLPIPGIEARTEIDEIQALTDAGAPLSKQELRRIDDLRADLGTRFCRRCGYCLPCPEGVPIPIVLNLMSMFRRVSESRFRVRGAEILEMAGSCRGCGRCEERCPYDLPVRDMLEESRLFYAKTLSAGSSEEERHDDDGTRA